MKPADQEKQEFREKHHTVLAALNKAIDEAQAQEDHRSMVESTGIVFILFVDRQIQEEMKNVG